MFYCYYWIAVMVTKSSLEDEFKGRDGDPLIFDFALIAY